MHLFCLYDENQTCTPANALLVHPDARHLTSKQDSDTLWSIRFCTKSTLAFALPPPSVLDLCANLWGNAQHVDVISLSIIIHFFYSLMHDLPLSVIPVCHIQSLSPLADITILASLSHNPKLLFATAPLMRPAGYVAPDPVDQIWSV